MKKKISFLKIATKFTMSLILLFAFANCKTQPSSPWWSNIEVKILHNPTEKNGETVYDEFTLKYKYNEDKKSTITFSQSEIDGYIEYIKRCGLTFVDEAETFYADKECTIPLTSSTRVRERTDISYDDNSKEHPANFAIYTKVNELIKPSNPKNRNGIYTEFLIYDKNGHLYNYTGPVLLPKDTNDEDIRKYIFKNYPVNEKSEGKSGKNIDNAEWDSIEYIRFFMSTLGDTSNLSLADRHTLSEAETGAYYQGANLQGCTLKITLDKDFSKLGLKKGLYTTPDAEVTFLANKIRSYKK